MLHRSALIGLSTVALLAGAAFGQAPPALKTKNIVTTGLNLPVGVFHAPGDTCRLFVIEKRGFIKVIDDLKGTPTVLATPFLNIDSLVLGDTSASGERGLLGLAFHPDYWQNGYFFVYYVNNSGNEVVARYKVSDSNPNVADTTALVLFTVTDPFSNHNGGWMDFGPDGYLYIATGDGGSANDPNGSGQNKNTKLGKMLRIDPNVEGDVPPYTNPSDNPYFGATAGDDSIWHWGLRNPWRCSFDRATGDLYIGDVGQNNKEEISFAAAGVGDLNFGWRCMEGFACTGLTGCTCNAPTLTLPIRDYGHVTGGGFCVIGGYMYRGPAIPSLDGFYIHSDYTSNNYWVMRYTPGGGVQNLTQINAQITPSLSGTTVSTVSSYGEDANGEIYLVKQGSTTTGGIFKLVAATGDVVWTPGDLNHDGVVDGADVTQVLGAWGEIDGDTNCDFMTDGNDITTILGNWTP